MRYAVLSFCALLLSLGMSACTPGWKRAGGVETLPALSSHVSSGLAAAPGDPAKERQGTKPIQSHRVALALPDDWSWIMRGDDLMATRDGVFLQHMLVERIPVGQAGQSSSPLPNTAFSPEQWPIRMARYLPRRFTPGMSPEEAAEVVLDSRRSNPGIAGLEIRKVEARRIAGYPGFRAVYDFRVTVLPRRTPYRTIYCGFIRDGWFYGISYTAALRQYFNQDSNTFEEVLQSVKLAGQ